MSVSLTSEQAQTVQRLVESGAYPSTQAVLDEALQLLQYRDQQREALRSEIAIGLDDLDSGRSQPLDWQRIQAQVNHRLKTFEESD